ncbi:MAG: decaprenyl-phosphate phosphoribosyltransferase [Actinomycetota bacterium]
MEHLDVPHGDGSVESLPPIRQSGPLLGLFEALRPRQWVKNVLVGAAPAAAGVILHRSILETTALTFVAFCLVASATYLLNDSIDAPADRLHPTKRNRPIARGDVAIPVALTLSVILALAGVLLGWLACTPKLGIVLVAYVGINIAYCFGLKRVPVIELGCVASGFILRAAAGGAATNLPLSKWFVVVVSFGALFIVTGKRMSEFQALGVNRGSTRKVLSDYSASFLESVLTLSAGISITTYCLWTFDHTQPHSSAHPHYGLLELTTVPVVLGVLHVLRLMDAGKGGSPEDLVYDDRLLQALGLGFVLLFALGLYV